MPQICSLKHWTIEMLKDTCIWYWGGTCWADAVGPGHNCTLSGCFRKENYEAKKRLTSVISQSNWHDSHRAQCSPSQGQYHEFLNNADDLADYLLGSKPLSLNTPSVCWAITRQQKTKKEKCVDDQTSTKSHSQKIQLKTKNQTDY